MSNLAPFGKLLVAVAVILSVIASLYILFTPLEIHVLTAVSESGGSEVSNEEIIHQSWYQVQGLWGVSVLVIISIFYGLAYFFAYKEVYFWLGILCLGLLSFSYLAGLSIGFFYFPAALVLLLGTVLLIFSRFQHKDG